MSSSSSGAPFYCESFFDLWTTTTMPISPAKIGRNEKCPCGSGKKFKSCHGHYAHPEFGKGTLVKLSALDIDQRWTLFIGEMKQILNLRSDSDWTTARSNFRTQHVTEIYRAYSQFFPPTLKLLDSIEPDTTKLSALYAGDIGPYQIERNILRFSLYSEKIYAFDPFHPPYLLMPGGESPLNKPESFLLETFKAVYFSFRLLPWIKSGVVTLLPNPAHLDQDYRKVDLAQGKTIGHLLDDAEIKADVKRTMLEKFTEIHYLLSGPSLRAALRKHAPNAPNDVVESAALYIESEAASNPALLPMDEWPRQQFMMQRGGASPFTLLAYSSMLNAFPYSDSLSKSKLLTRLMDEQSRDRIGAWTPLAQAFRQLSFEFLDKVDPNFAISLRADGRLESLRGFLFRIWQTQKNPEKVSEAQAILFAEELRDEYSKAKEDWAKIHESIGKFVATNTAVVLSGGLVVGFPAIGAIAPSVYKVAEYFLRRRRFKLSNPMSVFIDLNRK